MRPIAVRACLAAILLLAACFCLTELAEVDFHWHLLAGARMLDGGGVPRVDDLSYRSAGRPWIDLQWLFEVVLAASGRYLGPKGFDLLKILLVTGAFAMVVRAASKRSPEIVVVIVALLAVVASQERFALRPETATFLLLGTLALLLEDRRKRPRRLLAIPFLMALWANLHALYAVGLGVLALTLCGDLIEAARHRAGGGAAANDEPPQPRRLGAALALSVPATLLTPYGLAGWGLPVRLLVERIATRNLYGRNIAEFQSPFGGYGPTTAIAAFAVLALLVAIAALFCARRSRPADLLLLGSFLTLALLARRNVSLFALVAVPSGSAIVTTLLRRAVGGRESFRRNPPTLPARLEAASCALIAAVVVLLCVEAISNRFYARDAGQRYFGRGPAPGFYPETAARLVLERGVPGEVLNDLTMGGYLAWCWSPGRRVFIDGRLEVHDPDLFAAYLRLRRDPVFFEALARRDRIDAVLWSHLESAGAAELIQHLAVGSGWHLVFVDLASALFVRDGAGARSGGAWAPIDPNDPALLARLREEIRDARIESARADPIPALVRRVIPRQEVPVAITNAAIFFAIAGGSATAEGLFRDALAISPGNPLLHYDLGMVLARAGRLPEARAAFEAALARSRGFAPARTALGLLNLRAGDPEEALEQWRLAEQSGDLEPAALEARAALLAKRGRLPEAIGDYRALLRAEPGRSGARIDLARLQAADGDLSGSERSFRRALADQPELMQGHLGLAALLASSGRPEEALREARRAVELGLDPKLLLSEPALRALEWNPDFQRLLPQSNRP